MTDKSNRQKTISATYAEIQRCDQNGDYERALKASNRILHMEPQDQLAFHCKIVSFVHLSKFEDALQHMSRNLELSKGLYFEKAYCLYRLNRHSEALKIVDEAEEGDYRLLELKAQILYRLEEYEESVRLYREIIKNTNDDFEDEHQTNLSAAFVFLSQSGELENVRDDTYELCFNKACMLIAIEEYVEAERKLKQCEKLCRESLEEEEASEEEIDVDLALIRIQLGYVFQKQGKIKEARDLYVSTLKIKVDDPALVAVASNNAVCINKDQNIFDSKKKMKLATNDQLVHKLPSSVRKYIALNNAIFAFYANHMDQCVKLSQTLEKTFPELATQAQILSALTLVKADKHDEAIQKLKQFQPATDKHKLYLNLCCVQWLLMQNQRLEACKLMEAMGDDRYKPAIIGALITLYLSLGKEDTALKVFEKTVDWYRKNKVKGDLSDMWKQAAEFHMRNGQTRVAVNCLEELLKINPEDKRIIAQMVVALSQFDVKRAMDFSKKLPDVSQLSQDVDFEALENFGMFSSKKFPSKPDSASGTPRLETTLTKKKKQKKRKGKLPKYYDPKVTPDPERWLPKYERSGYRKKRDRRAKEVIKGSQGTASGQSEQFDFSSKVDYSAGDAPAGNVADLSPRIGRQQAKKVQQKKKPKRR